MTPSELVFEESKVEVGQSAAEGMVSESTKGGVPAGPGVENGELQDLRHRVQELQDENKWLSARCAESQKEHIDALFMICQLMWWNAVFVCDVKGLTEYLM